MMTPGMLGMPSESIEILFHVIARVSTSKIGLKYYKVHHVPYVNCNRSRFIC